MYGRLLSLALALFALLPAAAALAEVEVTLAEEKVRRIIRETDRIDTRSIPGKFSGIRVYALDGTAVDITLAELSLETFYPADDETAAALRALHKN